MEPVPRKQVTRDPGELFFQHGAGVNTFHYAVDVGDGWIAAMHFASDEGVISLTEYDVAYAPDAPSLDDWLTRRVGNNPPAASIPRDRRMTVRKLREIRVGEIEVQARRVILSPVGEYILPRGWATEPSATRRPGGRSRTLTDLALAQLAAEYVEELRSGSSPVAALAARHHLARSTVRNRIAEARKRGLLTTAGGRRPGGALTTTAREVLDGER